MTKRNWPDFEALLNSTSFSCGAFMKDWLEANIPKEVLDKIAPPIEEPVTITKKQLIEAARIIEKYCYRYKHEGTGSFLNQWCNDLWERLSGEK